MLSFDCVTPPFGMMRAAVRIDAKPVGWLHMPEEACDSLRFPGSLGEGPKSTEFSNKNSPNSQFHYAVVGLCQEAHCGKYYFTS